MADAALQHNAAAGHGAAGEYEAPLFGAYSKKVGMWLFLASDSLTFGALLFAFSYNRIYTAWPTPFGKDSIINATVMTACLLSSSLTMVLGVFAAQRGDRARTRLCQMNGRRVHDSRSVFAALHRRLMIGRQSVWPPRHCLTSRLLSPWRQYPPAWHRSLSPVSRRPRRKPD